MVLERRSAAVHRGVVEVGAELADRRLRVLAHEDLSAEADDGLVGRAVAVVLVAPAVQPDHPLDMLGGPEDVVVEEAVPVVGLLGHLRLRIELRHTNGGMPSSGRGVLVKPVSGCGTAPASRPRPRAIDGGAGRSSRPPADLVADVPAEPRYTGPVLPRPSMRSTRPPARCWSIAKSSAILTGSLVVMSVVAVDRMIRSVWAAMYPSRVVGGRRARTADCGARRGEHVEADLLSLEREGHHLLDAVRFADGPTGGRVRGDVADREDPELPRIIPAQIVAPSTTWDSLRVPLTLRLCRATLWLVAQLYGYEDAMQQDRLSAVFGALADPTRRAILARLADGDASVVELTALFAVSQPAISEASDGAGAGWAGVTSPAADHAAQSPEALPSGGHGPGGATASTGTRATRASTSCFAASRTAPTRQWKGASHEQADEVAEPDSPFIDMTRDFDAPRELLLRCAYGPGTGQAWLGPRKYEMVIDHYDARDGGTYRYIHRDDEGHAYAFHGVPR